jgi:tripeptidyl-peptidase I
MAGSIHLVVILLCALTSFAASVPYGHVMHEKRAYYHEEAGWVKRSRVPAHMRMPVRIGLTQRNLEQGDKFLMDISDPASVNYGKHWTAQKVAQTFGPSDDTIKAVQNWVTSSGIASQRLSLTGGKGWMSFDATAHEVERLLNTEYHIYEHVETGHKTSACET